jgi:hypothetical protein
MKTVIIFTINKWHFIMLKNAIAKHNVTFFLNLQHQLIINF